MNAKLDFIHLKVLYFKIKFLFRKSARKNSSQNIDSTVATL